MTKKRYIGPTGRRGTVGAFARLVNTPLRGRVRPAPKRKLH